MHVCLASTQTKVSVKDLDLDEDPSYYGKKPCKTYETFVVNNSLEKKVKLFEIKSPEDLKTVIKTLDITYFCI